MQRPELQLCGIARCNGFGRMAVEIFLRPESKRAVGSKQPDGRSQALRPWARTGHLGISEDLRSLWHAELPASP